MRSENKSLTFFESERNKCCKTFRAPHHPISHSPSPSIYSKEKELEELGGSITYPSKQQHPEALSLQGIRGLRRRRLKRGKPHLQVPLRGLQMQSRHRQ